MLISVSPVEGEHRMLINPDHIVTVRKHESCGCYTHCHCSIPTVIELNTSEKIIVEESINTLEARCELHDAH